MSLRGSPAGASAVAIIVLVLQQTVAVGAVGSATGTSIGSKSVVEQEGDVASFRVHLDDTSKARVQVGSEDVNYVVNLTVTGDYDDHVTIRMNTFKAGGWNGASPDEVFSAKGGSVSATRTSPRLNDPLDPGNYRIDTYIDGELSGIHFLTVKERETRRMEVFTAPKGTNADSLKKIQESMTNTSSIAMGDYLITKINASGLNGYISSAEDLDQGTEGVSISIYTERQNAGRETVDPDNGKLHWSGDELFLVFATNDLNATAGDTYTVQFEIDGSENPYVPDGKTEQLTEQVKIKERVVRFAEDPVTVKAASGQTINLSTTVAPGTKFKLEAVSDSIGNTFVKRTGITVSPNRTLSTSFDFSGVEGRTEFTLTVKGEGVEMTGYAGTEQTQTPTETTTPEPTTTANATTSNETTTTDPSANQSSPTPTTTSSPETAEASTTGETASGSNTTTVAAKQAGSGGFPTKLVGGAFAVLIVVVFYLVIK